MRDAKMVEFVFPIPLTKRILVAAHLASLANIVNKVKKNWNILMKKNLVVPFLKLLNFISILG